MTWTKPRVKWIVFILLAAATFKLALLSAQAFPFNSDEAIVALMARHILQGERPIFFYGQAYMGSLDAYLIAFCFKLFGESVICIRLVQIILYTGTILTTYFIGRKISGSEKAGLIAAILVAFPTVNVTLYTTVSLGGYGEALLIGNLILLIALSISQKLNLRQINDKESEKDASTKRKRSSLASQFCLLGFLIGLGLWADALTLVYSISACVYLIFQLVHSCRSGKSKKVFIHASGAIPGLLIGALPIELFFIQNGATAFIHEFFGSAVSVEMGSELSKIGSHLLSFFTLGLTVIFGIRPPWGIEWLLLPLIPFILIIWGWIIYSGVKACMARKGSWLELSLISSIMLLIFIGFVFTSFGVDPSGRYFLPITISLAILASWVIVHSEMVKKSWKWVLLLFLLVYNLGSTLQCAWGSSQAFTTQFDSTTIIDHRYDAALIQFLQKNHETTGYGTYWTTYPIDYLSQETLTYIPALPYHQDFRFTSRDDRYAPYDKIVASSTHIAYITANFPDLENRLRTAFSEKGISWKEKVIGDYCVFYDLSQVIRPNEINLQGASQ